MSDALAPRKSRNIGWIVVFVLLVLASVGVAAFMIQFNLSLQLKADMLDAAWEKWKTNGPKDYILLYQKRINGEETGQQFIAKVRNGVVQEALMNGIPLEKEQAIYHSMDRMFRDIDQFMTIDAKPGQKKTYTVAKFDEKTGAVRHYIRRVMGSRERVELTTRIDDWPAEQPREK